MAKNKDKLFSDYAKKPSVEPEVVKEDIPEVVEVVEEAPKDILVNAIIDGVDTCLNIRKDPEVNVNNQIAILGKGTKLQVVNPDDVVTNEFGEWYKVRLNGGDDEDPTKNGYAMKKFIKII